MESHVHCLMLLFLLNLKLYSSYMLATQVFGAVDQLKSGIFSYAVSASFPRIRITLPNFEKIRQRFISADAQSLSTQSKYFGAEQSEVYISKSTTTLAADAPTSALVAGVTGSFISSDTTEKLKNEVFNTIIDKRTCIAGRLLALILKQLIEPRTKFVSGLTVNVYSSSNVDIVRGRVQALEIKFDSIGYSMIQITGGGSLSVVGVDLKMRRLLFQDLHFLRKPYEIYADFVFKETDIVNSRIIRDLIQMLVDTVIDRVLSDPARGVVPKVRIKRVTIRSRRIYVHGDADLAKTGTVIPFEISTSAGVRDKQIVFLHDIQVVLNPDSFLRTSVPLVLTTPYTVDIGDDCYVEELTLSNDDIAVRVRSVVYPMEPFAVTPVVSRALFRYDLTILLSSLLRFKGGFLVKLYGPPSLPNLNLRQLLSQLLRLRVRLRNVRTRIRLSLPFLGARPSVTPGGEAGVRG